MGENVYETDQVIVTYYSSAFLEAAVQINVRAGESWKYVQMSRTSFEEMVATLRERV